jgi:hypothetical protein
MRRIAVISASVFAIALWAVAPAVRAYATIGHTWAASQVTYYVNPDNLYVSSASAIAAFQSAAANWSNQTRANIRLVYGGTTTGTSAVNNGKSEVFFRNESASGLASVTYSWWDGAGRLVDADVVFYEGEYGFYTGNVGCSGVGEYIEDMATHEFGHVLGLAHSSVGTATMYPTNYYCDTTWETLDPDDISGIESLYPPAVNTQPPATPTLLTVTPDSVSPTTSLALAWSDNSATEAGFRVEQSLDTVNWSLVAQLGSNVTSYTATNLMGGTQYWYRVSAYNSAGSSAASNVLSGITQAASLVAPDAPTSASPANGATNVGTGADLAWSGSNAQQYDVYFGTSPQPALYASNLASPSLALPSLAQGTTYYWVVVARNAVGSTAGPTWRFTTKANGKRR